MVSIILLNLKQVRGLCPSLISSAMAILFLFPTSIIKLVLYAKAFITQWVRQPSTCLQYLGWMQKKWVFKAIALEDMKLIALSHELICLLRHVLQAAFLI